MTTQIVHSQVKSRLHQWLEQQLSSESADWLAEKLQTLSETRSQPLLFSTFSAIARRLGKADLQLTSADLQAAEAARSGWQPGHWSLDQAGRTLLILSLPAEPAERYQTTLETLWDAADVNEQVALYQSLPLLPHAERFISRAREGLRTNITAVFNAIALYNPFPADYFETSAWNQMILKSVFIGSPLHQIYGLDRRANPELARMLSDYAHERWAAKREVTPELWRLVGPFLNEQLLADLEQAFDTANETQQLAAALACAQSSLPAAQTLLQQHPDIQTAIQSKQLDWQRFSQNYLAA
ncbi:MAG: EboA family metabolite traffic protein [Leptolyngbya sp. SIO4C1]|nr:EboA family metabolite traffic protein [Leptolyngbya sp. SIO4C1]